MGAGEALLQIKHFSGITAGLLIERDIAPARGSSEATKRFRAPRDRDRDRDLTSASRAPPRDTAQQGSSIRKNP